MDELDKTIYDSLVMKEQKILQDLMKNRERIEEYAVLIGEQPPPFELQSNATEAFAPQGTTPKFSSSVGFARRKVEVKNGEFFNKSLGEAAKIYMERRGKDEAVLFPEIIDALKQGGFNMKTGSAEEARLRLNLLKSANFTLIPPNSFGLTEVFGKRKRKPAEAPQKKKAAKKAVEAKKKVVAKPKPETAPKKVEKAESVEVNTQEVVE